MNSMTLTVPVHSASRYDVVIAGGGPSGCAAAIAAARLGARTVVVERYGRLGGAGVTNEVAPFMGGVKRPTLPHRILERIASCDPETLDMAYADLLIEAGVEIRLHSWAAAPLMESGHVAGLYTVSKQGFDRVEAHATVDATGDGDVAWGAGAGFDQGREGDRLLQPSSIMFRIAGAGTGAFVCGSEEQAHEVHLPDGTWHEVVARGVAAGELPGNVSIIRIYRWGRDDQRVINATQVNRVNGTSVADLTRAELEGRRQALRIVGFLRAHAPGYADCRICAMPAAAGVRETRRFHGVATLERSDLVSGRPHPDAVVEGACFVIDIHNPAGGGQAEGFAQRVRPYDIPIGCLIPLAVDGLVLSGRNISGTHEAHASYRVQNIAMAVGAASGTIAALAARDACQPREVTANAVRQAMAGCGWW